MLIILSIVLNVIIYSRIEAMRNEKLVRVFRERLLHVSRMRQFRELVDVSQGVVSIVLFSESNHVLQTASYGIGNSESEPLTYAA